MVNNMSEKLLKQDNMKYENLFTNDLYIESFYNFNEYEEEMLENNFLGLYTINVTLENGAFIEHKFVFIDKIYDDLILYPLKIPKENMYNIEQKIVSSEYNYVKFSLSDYKTKSNELIDFEGNLRKKEKGEKTVKFHEINFLVKPTEEYNHQNYLNSEMTVHIDKFSRKYQNLMNIHNYWGICEIVLILKTGEHINLFYEMKGKKENSVILKPLNWDNHIRNLNNIPSEHILYTNFKYYFYSKRISFPNEYSQHMVDQYTDDELICVDIRNFSNEVLYAIKSFKDKGKLLYSFIANIDGQIKKTTEVYEFVKFKDVYQWKNKFVILRAKKIPNISWYKTELSDIKAEKWEYIIG